MLNITVNEIKDLYSLSVVTPRLCIRTSKPEDADAMTAMLQVPGVSDQLVIYKQPYNHKESVEWCRLARDELAAETGWLMSIIRRDSDQQIGCTALTLDAAGGGDWLPERSAANFSSNTAEIGYWIGQDHWGKGYASEMVGAMLYFGFKHRDIAMIHASADPKNKVSDHILLKHQFHKCGIFKRVAANEEKRDAIRYELTKEKWHDNLTPI